MPRLPAEYQEVEYIQSSGTQYIDTGFKGNQDTAFEVKARMTSANSANQNWVGGDLDDANSISVVFGTGTNSPNNRFGGTVFALSYSDTAVGTDYVVYTDKNKYTLNGTAKTRTGTVGTFQTTYNMRLFQVSIKNGAEGFIGRIYYAKIWDNGTLVRKLIPCYRKQDGVIGMYDMVNGVFYTNQGTGSFIKGADKVVKIGKVYVWRRVPRLPSEYQEVEYIQTSGTQRINTGLYASNNIQTETKVCVETTELDHPLFGGTNGGGSYYHCTPYQSKWYCGINGSESNGGSYSNVVGTIYTVVYNDSSSYLNVNGSNVISVSGTQGQSSTTLCIAGRYNGSAWKYGIYKYYYFKMYNKSTGKYERDFVPCYRKSDNVIGLYDLVNDQFYTNAGSGTFTKGGDVVESVSNTVYKEFLVRPPQRTEEYVILSNGGSTNRFSDLSISGTQSVRNQTSYWQGYVQSTDSYGISYVVLPKKIVGFEIVMQALSQSNYGNAVCCLTNSVSDINSSAVRGITKGVWMSISSKNYNGNSTGSASIGGVGTATGGIGQSKSDATATGTFTGTLVNGVWNIGISLSNGQSWTGTMTLNNDVNDMYLIGFRGGGWYTGERSKFVSAKVTLLA